MVGNSEWYCYICKQKFTDMAKKYTTQEFIEKAKLIHGDRFDYNKVDYINSQTKVCIICPIHGEFWQYPGDHINKKCGCNKCKNTKSLTYEPIEGKKYMREYSIWKGMKARVLNPNTDDADRYFLRGITCCPEWIESFEAFYMDMGPCPEGYSLDRIDNNKGYCPENCRWASSITQSRNRGSFNKLFTYEGKTLVLKEWAETLGIKYTTLYNRIYRSGLSFEEAIKDDPFNRQINIDGESHTLKEWCDIYNIKFQTVINRIHKHHWDIKDAITIPKGVKRSEFKI